MLQHDQSAMQALEPAIVRDTIAAVFADPAYDVSVRESLGERLLVWVARTIGQILEALRGSADLRWIVIGVGIAIVLLIVARAAFLARAAISRYGASYVRGDVTPPDPWQRSQDAAAAGRYTDAAHELYLAVLATAAAHARLRLHPARTAGEYGRDLVARSSPLHHAFVEFTREYELAVWRVRQCDERCYATLWRLATALRQSVRARAVAA